MAVRFYDEALYNKIQKWIKDPQMTVLKPDEVIRLFQIKADQNNDKPLKLPLIAISREESLDVLSTNKKPLSFDGLMVEANSTQSAQLNAIPISIKYQLDIYTRYYAEGDEYLRNFIFNFINHPKLKIVIPYNNSNIEHISNIRMQTTVDDTSSIPQRLFPGQFTRWTIHLEIDDAYLFSVPFMTNVTMSEDAPVNVGFEDEISS